MIKRFWKNAASQPLGAGFVLMLDGKSQRTPAGRNYLCPTQALADAVVAEWQKAPEKFDPRQMPMTQLVATTQDVVVPGRDKIIQQVADYAASDLLCFRAAEPAALAAQQNEIWQPYLDWASARFGATLLHTQTLQLTQAPEALAALHAAVAALDEFHLTVLRQAADVTGSLILGLALVQGWRDAKTIVGAAELETDFQITHWGSDPAAEARRKAIERDLAELERLLVLL